MVGDGTVACRCKRQREEQQTRAEAAEQPHHFVVPSRGSRAFRFKYLLSKQQEITPVTQAQCNRYDSYQGCRPPVLACDQYSHVSNSARRRARPQHRPQDLHAGALPSPTTLVVYHGPNYPGAKEAPVQHNNQRTSPSFF